jgi:acyl-CoA thioesterase-1
MVWKSWVMKAARAVLLPVLAVTVCGVTGASASEVAPQKKRIVVLGDSLTSGYGIEPSRAYPALLQEKLDAAGLPYEVINAGISGDTTAGGLRRIRWAMGTGADILIIALGGNDGLRGVPPAQTRKNLEGIIDQARAVSPGVRVFVAGMRMPDNMGAEYVREFASVFPAVAKSKGTDLVPYLLERVGGVAALNQPDRIHPTEEGQRIIAETLWTRLIKALGT